MEKIKILAKRIAGAEDLPLPRYMTSGAAGLDLYAAVDEPVTILPGEIKLIPTGLKIALPQGYEAQIRPRSGLALKNGISMVNTPGTIDADYRGEIGVIMINFGRASFQINRGDRVAQMVFNKVAIGELIEVSDLDETERSAGGFGHTGK